MKLKKILDGGILLLIFLICVLAVKLVQSATNYENFQTRAVTANRISYTIYAENNKVGTVYDIESMNTYLISRFESKLAKNGGELFFGDSISVVESYVPQGAQKDSVEVYEQIAEQNDFLVKAMKIKDTSSGKDYFVSNLETWTAGIEKIENALTNIDEEHGVSSKTVLATTIEPEPVMVNINEVMNQDELIQTIMNEEHQTYQTTRNMSVEEISQEVGISEVELKTLNPNISDDSIVMPNVPIQVTNGAYRNNFTKTKIINVEEDVQFAIEYHDDDNLYTGTEQIVQEGIVGRQNVEYTVKDLTTGERIVQNMQVKNVIAYPQPQIVIRGTKEAPNVGTGEFIWPVESRRVSTEFGGDYLYGEYRDHGALDINQGYGAPIWAIDNGVVVESSFSPTYGYYIIIDHNNGFWSLYAHNQENIVHVGQIVPKGEIISYMGSTGLSTGPHLHLEIRVGGNSKANSVNPRNYIS